MNTDFNPTHYIDILTGVMKTSRGWKAYLKTHAVPNYASIGNLHVINSSYYLILNEVCLKDIEAKIQTHTGGADAIEALMPLRHSQLKEVEYSQNSFYKGLEKKYEILLSTEDYMLLRCEGRSQIKNYAIRFRSSFISQMLNILSRKNNPDNLFSSQDQEESRIPEPLVLSLQSAQIEIKEEAMQSHQIPDEDPVKEIESWIEVETPEASTEAFAPSFSSPQLSEEIDFVIQSLQSPNGQVVRLAQMYLAKSGSEVLNSIEVKRQSYLLELDEINKKIAIMNDVMNKIKSVQLSF